MMSEDEFYSICRFFSNHEYDTKNYPQCYLGRCYLCKKFLKYQDINNWKTNLIKNLIHIYLPERKPFLRDKKSREFTLYMIKNCFNQIKEG